MLRKTIKEIIQSNPSYASVLHSFGLQFYRVSEQTLDEACQHYGLNAQTILDGLEKTQTQQVNKEVLAQYPVDLIIKYLKHSHRIFINHKLPFIQHLVDNISSEETDEAGIINDLKVFVPLFIDEFIHHIHEEEDVFFTYISQLWRSKKSIHNASQLFYMMDKHSIEAFQKDHECHDDEMLSVRKITNGYTLATKSLFLKVIFSELKQFESELKLHAQIENDVLFPKALILENKIKDDLANMVRWN